MSDNDTHGEPPGTAQADRLYQGFPDFSAWGPLSREDADLWSRFAASLAERRQAATPEALRNAVEVAVRAAALDSGALEGLYSVDRGFTMTVAVQGLAWQQMVEERGAGVRELFEAQLAAYELVLDAVTQKLPITEAWIRALHETLCAPQKTYRVLTDQGWQEQELRKGEYKTRPNHVQLTDGTVHAYAPVDLVPTEMHRLVEQIRTPEFEAAHPVLQASYCHYAFVVIHPFADGNGRVARALASTFFYRAESIPLLVFGNQRPAYLGALMAADRGDFGSVISFFQDRGIDTMQLLSESLMTVDAPRTEELAQRLRNSIRKWNGLSAPELDLISRMILSQLQDMFTSGVDSLGLENLHTSVFPVDPNDFFISGYLRAINSVEIGIILARETADPIRSSAYFYVLQAVLPNPFPILVCERDSDDRLESRLEDLFPELTNNFLMRLDHFVQRQLRRLLANLAGQSDLDAS